MAAQETKSMLLPFFLIRDLSGLKSLSCLHKYKYKEINNALAVLLCSRAFAVIILPPARRGGGGGREDGKEAS